MGNSKKGSFDIHPDFNQWTILFTSDEQISTPSFIDTYLRFFSCEVKRFVMQPLTGHGLWDGKQVFGSLSNLNACDGPVAVLTRATLRIDRLKNFWNNVHDVGEKLNAAEGLVISYGMGELPFLKQATFSVWENETCMKAFAYKTHEHAEVIRKTRNENWYREELFVRFRVIAVTGFHEKIALKMCNLPAFV